MDNLDRLNEKLLKRERIFGYTVYLPSTYVIADYMPAGVDYICIAVGCGEDADCTAATLGAIMGVILGASKLPEKWLSPVGDEIKTCSLNLMDDLIKIPKYCV